MNGAHGKTTDNHYQLDSHQDWRFMIQINRIKEARTPETTKPRTRRGFERKTGIQC
jgi:hypothetical protein